MKFITTQLTLALLVNAMAAQISFFDQRFPPAPATRRTIVIRNGQLTGRRSAALQQEPDPQQNQQFSQQYEDSTQDQDQQQPIAPQPVSTQRPQYNGNGLTQQPVPSRAVNGFPRITQQKQQFGQTVGSEESDDVVAQRQDSGLQDISMEDVSTERITPDVTLSSDEQTTDDGFIPTEPEQKPIITTGSVGPQRKSNGNGRPRQPNGIARKTLVSTGQRPVGNDRKPSNGKSGRGRPPIAQEVDDQDAQVVDGQITDGQISVGSSGGSSGVEQDQTQGIGDKQKGGDDHHDHISGDPIEWLRNAVRGEPGADYPIFYTPPETGFKCSDQQYPGYYADVEARCQVFYICQEDGRSDAFLCPNGTIFSQQHYVCVWWHEFDCSTATQFYSLNAQLYTSPESAPGSAQPLESPDAGPSGHTREKPSTRPISETPIDSFGVGPEGEVDGRIHTLDGQQPIEGQELDLPQVIDSDVPSQQTAVDDSQKVGPGETSAQEVATTSAPVSGLRTPNGRPVGGIKGGRRSGISTIKVNGVRKSGQNGDKQRVSVTTTRPLTALKRNGSPKRNGNGIGSQKPILSSPADTARNGLQKSVKTNGSEQRKRLNGGTKTLFRDRTTQNKELDTQSSNNWYYYLTGL